jgi:NADPH-dependent stearoyl-CoA 9-desaturase
VKNAPAQIVKLVRMTTGGKQVRRQLSRTAA